MNTNKKEVMRIPGRSQAISTPKQNLAESPKTPEKEESNAMTETPRQESVVQQKKVSDNSSNSFVPPKESKMEVGLKPHDFQVEAKDLANTIHMVVQSKGGTGKTQTALYLASYFQRHVSELPLYCIDLDSNTQSFAAFQSFNVQQFSEVDINDEGSIQIDPTRFDGAFNLILESINSDAIVVMDTGAGASLWSLIDYIRDLDFPSLAAACDRQWRFVLHVVISGEAIAESRDSLRYLSELVDNPHVEFVIWGNEYFGELKSTYGDIVSDHGEMFQRNMILPMVTDKRLRAILQDMRTNHWSVTELFDSKSLNAIDKARVNQHFYGNLAGKPGIFRQLQYMSWRNE